MKWTQAMKDKGKKTRAANKRKKTIANKIIRLGKVYGAGKEKLNEMIKDADASYEAMELERAGEAARALAEQTDKMMLETPEQRELRNVRVLLKDQEDENMRLRIRVEKLKEIINAITAQL